MAIAQKTVQELPPRLQQCHERAQQALAAGNAHVAAELLASLLMEEPGCAEARQALCQARLAAVGGPAKGSARWLAALRLAWPLRRVGPALLRAGRSAEALRLADQLLCVDPYSRDVLVFMARCADACGGARGAVGILDVAASLYPSDPDCWRALAEQSSRAALFSRAAEAYKQLAELCPRDPLVRDALRRAVTAAAQARARETGQSPRASEPATEAAAVDSVTTPGAEESLAEQVARYPHDSRRRFDFAEMLYAQGKPGEALEHFEAARNHPNLKTRALAGMGRCLLAQGQAAEAIPLFEQALQAGLGGPLRERLAVIYDCALACERAGRASQANALLKDIFAQDQTFRDVGERLRRLAAAAPAPPPGRRRQ
jgi:tetratricopeptide (TPR) repeat protein